MVSVARSQQPILTNEERKRDNPNARIPGLIPLPSDQFLSRSMAETFSAPAAAPAVPSPALTWQQQLLNESQTNNANRKKKEKRPAKSKPASNAQRSNSKPKQESASGLTWQQELFNQAQRQGPEFDHAADARDVETFGGNAKGTPDRRKPKGNGKGKSSEGKSPQTPHKGAVPALAYAGPTFQNSPSAASLPAPLFKGKSKLGNDDGDEARSVSAPVPQAAAAKDDTVQETAPKAAPPSGPVQQSAPAPQQSTPAPLPPTPASQQSTPVPLPPAPAMQQPTPISRQAAPASQQPTPIPQQAAPASQQATPTQSPAQGPHGPQHPHQGYPHLYAMGHGPYPPSHAQAYPHMPIPMPPQGFQGYSQLPPGYAPPPGYPHLPPQGYPASPGYPHARPSGYPPSLPATSPQPQPPSQATSQAQGSSQASSTPSTGFQTVDNLLANMMNSTSLFRR